MKKKKKTAERESILRDIFEKIRSSLDIEEIKHEIVVQTGIFFKADFVCVAYYDYKIGSYIVTKEAEYKISDKIKSRIGVDFSKISGFVKRIKDLHVFKKKRYYY